MGWTETERRIRRHAGGLAGGLPQRGGPHALKQVPGEAARDAEVVRLQQLAEWLERHERECREQVDAWMVRSLPVPVACWPGCGRTRRGSAALRDLVVAPVDADGDRDPDEVGSCGTPTPAKAIGDGRTSTATRCGCPPSAC